MRKELTSVGTAGFGGVSSDWNHSIVLVMAILYSVNDQQQHCNFL